MSERNVVDTNVLLRYLLSDDPVQSVAASAFFGKLASGAVVAVNSDIVLIETIYILEKQRRIDRPVIRRDLIRIITLSSVELPDKRMYAEGSRPYVERPSLSFADCYRIVLARKLAAGRLVTFDGRAGRAEGFAGIEPA